jgi:hypothetical protein
MPTFCRHNRFLERCPICSKSTPAGMSTGARATKRAARAAGTGRAAASSASGRRASGMRVRHEGRAEDDGYRSELVPGVRASVDADRLAQEIAFASGRLLALSTEPPGLYGEAQALASEDLERATWTCFLIAYLAPLEHADDPYSAIRSVLAAAPLPSAEAQFPDLQGVALGPRAAHESLRGAGTLNAYRQWVQRAGAPGALQSVAFRGEVAWTPERRFERLFERLALPGFGRVGRYELLVTLGRLGLYELHPDSLHLAGTQGLAGSDPTTLAAKRVFGIGDPLLLDRRATALAEAVGVPVEALDLALGNWAAPERASVGFPPEASDPAALERATGALGL